MIAMAYTPPRPLLPLLLTLAAAGCDPRTLPPLAPPLDGGTPEPATDAAPQAPPPTLTPTSGSMSGYFEVALDLSQQAYDASAVTGVDLAGRAGIYLTADGDTLRFMVQGSLDPGPADLVVYTPTGERTVPGAFTYDPPRVDGIRHVVAIGASLSQGFQAGAPTAEGTLGSPPAWVARQLGAYLGMPLFVDGLFRDFTLDEVADPPLCETPDVTGWVTGSVAQLVPKLTAASGNGVPLAAGGRVDPLLESSHLAISGSTVAETLYGPGGGGSLVLGHLVYDPDAAIFDPIDGAPIERAEALAPDILLAIDVYGNDVLLEDPPETMAEETALRQRLGADITDLVERMAASGAEVFVGDIPPTSVMPEWQLSKALAIRDADPGTEDAVAAELDADVAIIDERTRIANETLYAAAARFDNVHLVPTAQAVLDVLERPLVVGETELTFEMFGGLIGLDGVHFTDTGSAYTANLIITAINETLDVDVPLVDLTAVLAADPESPAALVELGIPIDACFRGDNGQR